VPANHPVKLIKQLAGAALKELSPRFEQMYSEVGRPSIPPERLLKASLFDGTVHVRSERMFREQLDYNLFFCWPWILTGTSRASPPSFSRIRRRLLGHEVAGEFFRTVAAEAREPKLTATSTFL
jgi:transposase